MKRREFLVHDLVAIFRNQTKKVRSVFPLLLKDYIPMNEYAALKVLKSHGDQMVSEIADQLHVTNSHISVTSDKLIHRDLVTRKHSKEDRRIVFLSITPKGEQLAEEMYHVLQNFYDTTFSDLSEEEIEMFIELLKKIKM